jgi:hypothetical protein
LNTAEELERITDRGKFERLVTLVLRKDNRDYAAIVETGTNAKAETIRSPVDGFCRVPGSSPPHFLLVEHTTTDTRGLKGLEEKWLADPSIAKKTIKTKKSEPKEEKEGDLLKAARVAHNLKNDFSNAKFTVILTTNLRLNLELITKVEKKAEELGVYVDFYDQSRIAGFLDSEPEGQYLCDKYLGIKAKMLSQSLLHELCERSLENYEKQFLTSPNTWVSREIDSQIEKGTYSNAYTIQLLIGESGSGKSAAAYQILKKHLASGGYGLWISDELLKECTLIENAIDRVLRELYPSLLPDAGRAALRFIQESSRLLLIVDDVNRADNPPRLVENIIKLLKPQQSGTSDSQLVFSPYLVVCPVWSKFSNPISLDFKEKPWINPVFINSMNSEEAMAAVQSVTSLAGREITNTEAASLATKLGNDPILIGLFYELLLSNSQQDELERFTENVIEQFITTTLSESSNSGKFLENEYRASLSTVATQMLKSRKLYPLWTDIGEWLKESPDKLNALRELINYKKLCRLTKEDKFDFRHERIRETLLVESMIKLVADATPDSDILYEPFYAEIIGRAIARSPQSKEFLQELRNRLPLALVEAIRCFGTRTTNYHHTIVEEVKEWVNNSIATGSVPESVLNAVCWSLVETDFPVVLEITEAFSTYSPVFLARFRNGCAESGIRYCLSFDPFCNNCLRDEVLEQVKRHHKYKILTEVRHLLKSRNITDEWRNGVLTLAGFLGFPELAEAITTCWELSLDKTAILPWLTWAIIQICNIKHIELLNNIVNYWAKLAEEQDSFCDNPFQLIVHKLGLILQNCTKSEVLNYFIAQCFTHKSLQQLSTHLGSIDAPDVIEFIFTSVADLQKIEVDTDKLLAWESLLFQICHTLELDCLFGRRRLSQTFMDRLKAWWEGSHNNEFVKQRAFYLWCASADENQLEILRAIPSNSSFFSTAVKKRAELGDRTAVRELIPLLSTKVHLFSVAHHVWCGELLLVAQHYLEALKDSIPKDFSGGWQNEHCELSRLLRRIPVNESEILLERYWEYLGYSPPFIQTALYVGTSKCIELAAASISQCPNNIPLFRLIGSTFGFLDSEKQKHLTMQHLERLLPYLDRLNGFQVWELAEVCQWMEISEWSRKHLSSRLSEKHQKRYHPSDDDLLQDLNEFATDKHGVLRVTYWLEEFDKRHDPKSRALSIVDCWLAFNPTVKGLQIAAACIQSVGTRKDLSILDQYTIEGSPNEIAKIKESTRFAVYRRSLD